MKIENTSPTIIKLRGGKKKYSILPNESFTVPKECEDFVKLLIKDKRVKEVATAEAPKK